MAAQLQFTPMPGALQYILHTKVTYPHNLHMVESLLALFLNRTENMGMWLFSERGLKQFESWLYLHIPDPGN